MPAAISALLIFTFILSACVPTAARMDTTAPITPDQLATVIFAYEKTIEWDAIEITDLKSKRKCLMGEHTFGQKQMHSQCNFPDGIHNLTLKYSKHESKSGAIASALFWCLPIWGMVCASPYSFRCESEVNFSAEAGHRYIITITNDETEKDPFLAFIDHQTGKTLIQSPCRRIAMKSNDKNNMPLNGL